MPGSPLRLPTQTSSASGPGQDLARDMLIIKHDIGILQHMERPQRQKIGIPRARADEMHRPGVFFRQARLLDRPRKSGFGVTQLSI